MSRKKKRHWGLTQEQQAQIEAFNRQVAQQQLRAAEAFAAGKPLPEMTFTLTMKTDGTNIEIETTPDPKVQSKEPSGDAKKRTRKRKPGSSQSIRTMRG